MTDLTDNDLGKITAVPNVCLKQTTVPKVSQENFRKIMLLVEAAKAMQPTTDSQTRFNFPDQNANVGFHSEARSMPIFNGSQNTCKGVWRSIFSQ